MQKDDQKNPKRRPAGGLAPAGRRGGEPTRQVDIEKVKS
jgi:hypothetical protein